jgi:hypothetical protein
MTLIFESSCQVTSSLVRILAAISDVGAKPDDLASYDPGAYLPPI